jgi:DNA mismatch repair ATPase MutS
MEEILLYDKNVLDILNVFPRTDAPSRPISEDCNEESNSKCTTETSLFSILNQTKSKMGSRLLRLWLQHPLRDKRLIEERQAVIDLFIGNVEKLNLIRESREHLKTFADMERLGKLE